MISIIILTHGELGQSFIDTLSSMHGECGGIKSFSVDQKSDIELQRNELLKIINTHDITKGVLLLTDLFGGTASNLAFSTTGLGNIAVLSGVNLPMLIKLASIYRHCTLEEAVQLAQDYGKKYIRSSHEIMSIASDESRKFTGL